LWVSEAITAAQERDLIERFRTRASEEYRSILTELEHIGDELSGRTLGRLRRELQRIARRDFFPPDERDAARSAVAAAMKREVVR
jgi:hypothetical protein